MCTYYTNVTTIKFWNRRIKFQTQVMEFKQSMNIEHEVQQLCSVTMLCNNIKFTSYIQRRNQHFCQGVEGSAPLVLFFKKSFFNGLMSKKGNFQLLHADLFVFNSNRFFLFLKNLVCARSGKENLLNTWFNYRYNYKK